MKKKYYVYYVEDCTPAIKEFKTLKARKQFLEVFQTKYGNSSINWIDFTFDGNIRETFSHYELTG